MRYNAGLALVKQRLHAATVVLGSATRLSRRIKQYKKRYRYCVFPKGWRTGPAQGEIIDMKVEKDERGSVPILSVPLREHPGDLEAQKRCSSFKSPGFKRSVLPSLRPCLLLLKLSYP